MGFISKINYLRIILWAWMPFFGVLVAEATSFTVVPLETQVQNAGGAIWGRFQGSASKKVMGSVVTEASFELLAVSGVAPSEIVNKNNFKIIYPGGVWRGIVYATLGTPKFSKNEEVVLFIVKGPYGYQLANLGLSKYLVIKKEGEEVSFQNSIFPEHPHLGKISLEHLNSLLKERFQEPLSKATVRDKNIYKRVPASNKRSTSSLQERKPGSVTTPIGPGDYEKKSHQSMIWIILMFSILGGYIVVAKRSE